MSKGKNLKDSGRNIPACIKRQVLIEAGHSCAIPTCQYPATQFAHIIPFERAREHRVDNIIALCPNHHDQYDNKKTIDRKSIKIYKQKLQFLNKRYTKYELRLLALLAEKPIVLATGEIEVQWLLKDGLIENKKTFMTQSIELRDQDQQIVYEDKFTQSFAATLTRKGKDFIKNWKSDTDDIKSFL